MSYNGSGTFVINTAGQPVVSGTVISSTAFNALTADLATGLSTAITKDGQTTPTANIPMGNNKITGLAVGTAATDAATLSQVQSTAAKLIGSVSGADTITGTLSPTLAAYAAGQMFYFVAAGTNTSAVTINIDGLGAKAVTRDGSTALTAGDLRSGEVIVIVYDGTRFQVVSQVNSGGDATFASVSITSALNVGGVATFTGNPVLSGGTANGVLYLNASKVATSGSAVTYDGTTFGTTGAANFATSSGNVGIGTSSPSFLLHASTSSAAGTVTSGVRNTAADGSTRFALGNNAGIARATISLNNNSDEKMTIGPEGSFPMLFQTNGTERMRLDTSGNLGLGVTPSAWGSTYKQMQVGQTASFGGNTSNNRAYMFSNAFFDGSAYKYITTSTATSYEQSDGAHYWFRAASGTAGNAITFTQAMTLDASGNLGLNTTTFGVGASNEFAINGSSSSAVGFRRGNTLSGYILSTSTAFVLDSVSNLPMLFYTNDTERARITGDGLLLVNTTSGTTHVIKRDTASTVLTVLGNGGQDSIYINSVDATGANLLQGAALYAQKSSTTSRSINAGGTINASGADYAEYMLKAGDFVIAKGDLCGIDENGKLTNVFADSVSFVVKSTNPSYVGGDTWASEELIGKKPTDEEELKKWHDRAEESRQKVDRIAFSGQVPVNVLGATPGQYIVPSNDNGAIKGVAVSNPTFEQYQAAVGKVIAVQDDGRAVIIVKVV